MLVKGAPGVGGLLFGDCVPAQMGMIYQIIKQWNNLSDDKTDVY